MAFNEHINRIEGMRKAISSVYPGDDWDERVADMHDGQVLVVYNSFLARGLIGKTISDIKPPFSDRLTEITDTELIRAFDEAIKEASIEQLSIGDLKTN